MRGRRYLQEDDEGRLQDDSCAPFVEQENHANHPRLEQETVLVFSFFSLFIYSEREWERERESERASTSRGGSERSWHEPKPRVGCLTDWATQTRSPRRNFFKMMKYDRIYLMHLTIMREDLNKLKSMDWIGGKYIQIKDKQKWQLLIHGMAHLWTVFIWS